MLDLTLRIREMAERLAPRLVAVRRELHRHPELSLAEVETTRRLRGWLEEAGIPVLPLGLSTGLVAEVRGAKPGPVVAVRADIDALPIHEETGLEYASCVPGRMHACGHDFHSAIGLGAALIIRELAPELAGTVRFLFQPAEEIGLGAQQLIAAGALNGVQMIFGLHNKPDVPAGQVGIRPGPLMAATDAFTIEVSGKGGHAAIPEATVDPIVAGSAIVMALQTAVSRSISPLDSAVVSVGAFQAGSAHNVIPPAATLLGTLRTFTGPVREHLKATIERLAREVAAGYGAGAQVAWSQGTPAVTNDPGACEVMRRAAEGLGLPVVEAVPSTAGEDFAEYQRLVPGCFVWLGTGCPESWHHPRFTVDESVLPLGAALLAFVALEALRC